MLVVTTYIIYLILSIAITIWVGNTLHRSGRHFLIEMFRGNEAIADSVNHLLLVGFYLVNIGFVSLALSLGRKPTDAISAIEYLSTKLGFIILLLGFMHFFNIKTLSTFRDHKLFRALSNEPSEHEKQVQGYSA